MSSKRKSSGVDVHRHRPSVFSRLGTKSSSESQRNDVSSSCETTELLSHRSKSHVRKDVKKSGGRGDEEISSIIDTNWENWNENNLDYDDELMLEKKRQLLQRELEKQIQEENPKKSSSNPKVPSSSSSSSTTSSSESESSETSGSESSGSETSGSESNDSSSSSSSSSSTSSSLSISKKNLVISTRDNLQCSNSSKIPSDIDSSSALSKTQNPSKALSSKSSLGSTTITTTTNNIISFKKRDRHISRNSLRRHKMSFSSFSPPDSRPKKLPISRVSDKSTLESLKPSQLPLHPIQQGSERDKFGFYCMTSTNIKSGEEVYKRSGSTRRKSLSPRTNSLIHRDLKSGSKSNNSKGGKRSNSLDRRLKSPNVRHRARRNSPLRSRRDSPPPLRNQHHNNNHNNSHNNNNNNNNNNSRLCNKSSLDHRTSRSFGIDRDLRNNSDSRSDGRRGDERHKGFSREEEPRRRGNSRRNDTWDEGRFSRDNWETLDSRSRSKPERSSRRTPVATGANSLRLDRNYESWNGDGLLRRSRTEGRSLLSRHRRRNFEKRREGDVSSLEETLSPKETILHENEKRNKKRREERDIGEHCDETYTSTTQSSLNLLQNSEFSDIGDSDDELLIKDSLGEAEVASKNPDLLEGISDEDLEVSDEMDENEKDSIVKAKLAGVLGADWSSLILPKSEVVVVPGAARKRWTGASIFNRIGLSEKYLGSETFHRLIEQANEGLETEEEKVKILHSVAGIHVIKRKKLERRTQLFSDFGPYCRALSARKDISIRRALLQRCEIEILDLPPPNNDLHLYNKSRDILKSVRNSNVII